MDSGIAAARGHPAVVASLVVAAVAITTCAMVAIAWMLGCPTRDAEVPPPPSPPTRVAPVTPNYSRAEVAARPDLRALCVNCGTVESIRPVGDGWEVRVRYDDGSGDVKRYDQPPRLRRGDRVHVEEGRLLRD
jgi:hypothetical protein